MVHYGRSYDRKRVRSYVLQSRDNWSWSVTDIKKTKLKTNKQDSVRIRKAFYDRNIRTSYRRLRLAYTCRKCWLWSVVFEIELRIRSGATMAFRIWRSAEFFIYVFFKRKKRRLFRRNWNLKRVDYVYLGDDRYVVRLFEHRLSLNDAGRESA